MRLKYLSVLVAVGATIAFMYWVYPQNILNYFAYVFHTSLFDHVANSGKVADTAAERLFVLIFNSFIALGIFWIVWRICKVLIGD